MEKQVRGGQHLVILAEPGHVDSRMVWDLVRLIHFLVGHDLVNRRDVGEARRELVVVVVNDFYLGHCAERYPPLHPVPSAKLPLDRADLGRGHTGTTVMPQMQHYSADLK